ncbi:sugar phosphate nucleotidyltransferase [Paenibacillus sp. GCM10023252]|uniref:sugar phosphate nucleotidyltransferase n=1 Tax=Paenibacillus sp. GCM10023252 TaxID=3252649 RepID=UPI00360FC7E6
MKIILLSGGSGKRLWPLSNDFRSKQFLSVLEGPEGRSESMVQRVWRQLEEAGLAEHSYIATGRTQVEVLQSQLGTDVPLIVEPERRDTFPAIALASTYLYSIAGVSLNETVVIMPVDPYVEQSFYDSMKLLDPALKESGADLSLIGVRPTAPSENYGYIVPATEHKDHSGLYRRVASFKEKPKEADARQLIQDGALWNCGVFAFKLDLMITMLMSMGLPIQYDEMHKQYKKLKKNSFDYEVVENAEHITVIPYEGEWRDLGTWTTLSGEMKQSVLGKGSMTADCENTHLINELETPISIIGLSNVIVAASPDGIIVSDKSMSTRIKEIAGQMDQRPMYEERRWGYYKVIDFLQYPEGREILTKRICITAGKNLSYQYHMQRSEVWTVISGQGELIMNEQHQLIKTGDVIQIPVGTRHSIRAVTDLEIIEVQSGELLVEEDIVRLSMKWEEIISMVSE